MVPLDGPHKNKTEGARTKAAPLATAVSAKRATRSKSEKSRKPAGVSESVLEPQITTVASGEQIVSEDAIRLSAYFKWVVAGRPDGDGVGFWLEAERELMLPS
jgi:hypothetical protein